MFLIILLTIVYIAGFYFAPFPYWRTYFILWRQVLFCRERTIHAGARRRQILRLLRYAVLCPLWTFLWYLDDLLFPGYKKRCIKPVFIIGQPRSGTTFLHRTLAEDENSFFAVRDIEWRYPYITVQKLIGFSGLADRLRHISAWPDTEAGRRASKMHRETIFDWEEDGTFFNACFLHHFFVFFRFPYPELLSYLDNFHDLPEGFQEHMLNTHQKVIQKIMYLRKGEKIYLSKEVTSHNKMERIQRLYPEARFIVMVRPSEDYMNSLMELVRMVTLTRGGIDPVAIPGWETVFIERMRQDSLLLTELCNSKIVRKNQIRLSFDRFTGAVVPSVKYIYNRLELMLDLSYLQSLERVQESQQQRERGYSYEKRQFEGFDGFDGFVSETDREHQIALEGEAGLQNNPASCTKETKDTA